jgi:hypothetical protein
MFCADLKKIIDFYYLIGGNCVEIKQLCIWIGSPQINSVSQYLS